MGVQAPPELLGIHTNMPNVIPPDIDGMAFTGKPAPENLTADEKLAYDRLSHVYATGIGYAFQMGLRPQTLYGIADSPVGLAAYFLDHDARSYEMIARVFAGGGAKASTRDDVLGTTSRTHLVDEYGTLRCSPLLGEQRRVVLRRQRRRGPDGRERLPGRTSFSCAAELGKARLIPN